MLKLLMLKIIYLELLHFGFSASLIVLDHSFGRAARLVKGPGFESIPLDASRFFLVQVKFENIP